MKRFSALSTQDRGVNKGIVLPLVGLVLVAVVPLLVFGWWVAWRNIDQEKTAVTVELSGTARALRVAVDRELLRQFTAMQVLASDANLDTGNLGAFQKRAFRAVKANGQWLNVGLIDPRSHKIIISSSSLQSPAPTSLSSQHVDQVVQTRKPVIVGTFASSKITQGPIVLLMSPVIRGNEVRYVLGVAINPESIGEIFAEHRLSPTWTGAVLDDRLILAGRSRDPKIYVGLRAPPTLAKHITASDAGMFSAQNQEGATVYTAFSRSPFTGWSVAIGVPAAEIDGPIRQMLLKLVAAAGGLIACALVLTGGVGIGIVRRRNAYEQSRQESEKRYSLQLRELAEIYANTPAGLFAVDLDMRFLRINSRMTEINGKQIDGHLGRTIDEVLPADLAATLKEIWRPVLERGESVQNVELQGTVWRSPDVARHWQASYHPLLTEEGEVIGLTGSVQDITDRKLAEQSALRSERFLREIFDAISANICVLDERGMILSVNKGWCDFASSNPPSLDNFGIGLNYLSVCDAARGEDREEANRFAGGIRSVLAGETGLYIQEYPCHSAEEQRWFQGSVTRFVDEKTARVVVMHKTITERKLAEHALQLSEERYRAVVEDQTEIITRFLPDGTYTFVNDVYCRLFGKTREELIGRSWQPAALSEDLPSIEAELAKMSASHPVVVIENRVYDASGEVRWMQFVNRGFYDDRGRLVEIQAVGRDITARKEAERELQESNQQFSTVFHASPVAIAISDMETGAFIDVNDSFLEMCGYERTEVIGHTSLDLGLWHIADHRAELMRALREHGRVQQFETAFRYKSGQIGHLLLAGELIELNGRQYMIGMLSDITARKKTEMALAGINEELELQVAERTASLSLINEQLTCEIDERKLIEQAILDHQLKLKSMAFELSMAEERERDRIAGELHDQVGQRLILAKMKLDSLASRLSSEHLECDADEIARLISQTIQEIRSLTFQIRPPLLASAGLEATVQWLGEELKRDYGLRVELTDDNKSKPLKYEIRSTIFQAVRELLLNVAKHAGTDAVQVHMEREADLFAIAIRDSGIGFDTSEISERASKTGGFGLFNVQQKIEYLGGCMAIYSKPGEGTMATIKVPLEKIS